MHLEPELAAIGFEDIALTTNASQLARLAKPLAAAGLHRINISIDTLDPARFRAVTRGGDLAKVLAGIDAALAEGFAPIKLNTVVLRGVNDDADALVALSERLIDAGVLPYYLHLLDRVAGTAHFDVDDARGRSLVQEMRERLPGYLVPQLVREVPGAASKTPA